MDPENSQNLYSKARTLALRLLARSAKSSCEVKRRLLKADYPEDIADSVIEELKEKNFVNDESFAKEWISRRFALKGLGRYRLGAELREKGLDPGLIERYLSTIDDSDELEKALELAQKQKERRDRNARQTAGFLKGRGFSCEIIQRAVRRVYQ